MTDSQTCPACGAAATGNFCAQCGAALGQGHCAACGAALSPGARFCHHCGAAAGTSRPAITAGPAAPRAPWMVASALCILAVGGVAWAAHKRSTPTVPDMANSGNTSSGVEGSGGLTVGRAPPIENMSPKERFTRLEARVTQAMQRGDTATVVNFTPMALGAYEQLPDSNRDIDTRYHAAMLEAQVGMFDQARALADTILMQSPDNLFGYYVRATVAEFAGDSAAAKKARAAFRDHYDVEIKKNRPEYNEHRPFLTQYRADAGAH